MLDFSTIALVAAAMIAVTPSGSLTTDVQTSLQALDTAKAPTSHTHFSSAISDSTAAGRALLTAADVPTQQTLLGFATQGFQSGDVKETAAIVLPTGWYWCDGSNKNRVTDAPLFNAITIQQSGVLVSGSAIITGLSDTSSISPGMPISAAAGGAVPSGAVIKSVDFSTQVTMSANAGTSATTAIVFAPYGVGDGATTFGLPNRAYIGVGRDNARGSASNLIQVSTSLNTTAGTPLAVVGSATGLFVGMYVTHGSFPSGTKINAISGLNVTLSNNAAANGILPGRFSPVLDAQTLGATGGELGHLLQTAEIPSHTHTATSTVTDPGHTHAATLVNGASVVNNAGGAIGFSSGTGSSTGVTNGFTINTATTGVTVATTNNNSGGGLSHSNMPPVIVMNYIINR